MKFRLGRKWATAARFADMMRVQVLSVAVAQSPVQAAKRDGLVAVAVIVTLSPWSKATQSLPQLTPGGSIVTVPRPPAMPVTINVSVAVGPASTAASRDDASALAELSLATSLFVALSAASADGAP